jgi:hypothetical protein
MTGVLLGFFIFAIGVDPDLIGMNRSRIIGFVQMGVWMTGLTILLLGATATVRVVRNGRPHSLRAEVGVRLIATGYVVAATATYADFLSIGSHQMPQVHFGEVQVMGLALGVITSLIGLVLYWPATPRKKDQTATPPVALSTPGQA